MPQHIRRRPSGEPTRTTYTEIDRKMLICHARHGHNFENPTLWEEQHPTLGFVAWLETDECTRCGTVKEHWKHRSRRRVEISQAKLFHPDGYLIQGGNSCQNAKDELHGRLITEQNLSLEEPGNVAPMRRGRKAAPPAAFSDSG